MQEPLVRWLTVASEAYAPRCVKPFGWLLYRKQWLFCCEIREKPSVKLSFVPLVRLVRKYGCPFGRLMIFRMHAALHLFSISVFFPGVLPDFDYNLRHPACHILVFLIMTKRWYLQITEPIFHLFELSVVREYHISQVLLQLGPPDLRTSIYFQLDFIGSTMMFMYLANVIVSIPGEIITKTTHLIRCITHTSSRKTHCSAASFI